MADIPRVLVVDDEPADNQFLTLTVRGLGHQTESVFDGQAAIAWLQENRPSLVLLDALLPKADGFAVLQEVRRLHPDAPVYMMSGVYKKKSYRDDAVGKLGATAYLHKPVSVLQVWEILERHLPVVPAGEVSKDFPGVPFWRRPLPAVIGDLWAAGKTGLLFVRGNGGSGILFFDGGRLVFGRCNDPQLRLDRVLLQLGKLPREKMSRVAEIAAASKGRVGDALVAEGLITPQDLAEALSLQQRNHVSRPLTWTEGSSWFLACDAPRHETFKMQLDEAAMIFWSCRHLEVDEHLIRFLPRADRKVRATRSGGEVARQFGLAPEEVSLVDMMDGTRTVGQLRAIGRMLQLDVERILAGLLSVHVLEVAPEGERREILSPLFGSTVPVAGDLSRFSPTMLLVSMAFSRKTGVLHLDKGTAGSLVQRTIHFENGEIAFATSNDPGDRIGQVLLRVGLLTKDQLQEALALAQATPGTALGRILVARGMLRPDDLHAALCHQAQQVVTGLVGWTTGTFRFSENDGPGRDIVPLGLDTRVALMTALRTCPFTEIAPHLPAPRTRLRATATAHQLAADLPLTPLEERLRAAANGTQAIQQLASSFPEGPEAVLRAIFALTTIGVLEGFMLIDGEGAPAVAAPQPAFASDVPLDAPTRALQPVPAAVATGTVTGETTAERARRARVLAEDESFDVPSDDDALDNDGGDTAASPVEDWSSPEECSFAGLGDGPSAPAWGDLNAATTPEAPALAALPAIDFATPAMVAGTDSLQGLLDELAGELPLDAPPDWSAENAAAAMGGPVTARGPSASAATSAAAVAVAAPAWDARKMEALCDFLAGLADWLRACPEAVPESVRARLPREVRDAFGL